MSQPPHRHSVRRIVLPSGRSIEIVRFHGDETPQVPLHVCPDCRCDLVQPVDWSEAPHGLWELLLQGPNCVWSD